MLLISRRFGYLWTGQLVSAIGDPLLPFALAVALLADGGSGTDLALVFGGRALALLISVAAGGLAADLLSPVPVMVAAEAVRITTVTLIALSLGDPRLPVLVALVVCFGIADGFFKPAYKAVVPAVVPEVAQQNANSKISAAQQTGKLLGPALAGIIVGTLGARVAVAVDAVSFAVSLALLVPLIGVTAAPRKSRNLLRESVAGLSLVARTTWLYATILVSLIQVAFCFSVWLVLLPIVLKVAESQFAYSACLTCLGLGALLGALCSARLRGPRPGTAALLGLTPFAVVLLLLATAPPLWLLAAAHVAAGFGLEVYGVLWVTAVQREVPRHLLGRVFSIDMLGGLALAPLGIAAVPGLAGLVGNAGLAAAAGVAGLLIVVVPLMSDQVRRLGSARTEGEINAAR